MAVPAIKTVNPTALADGLKILHAVDSDGAVKEFITAAVNANMTVDPLITVGAGSWKSVARDYMSFPRNGLDPAQIVYDGANLPPVIDQFNNSCTFVVLFHDFIDATGNFCDVFAQNVTGLNMRLRGGPLVALAPSATNSNILINTTVLGGKAMLAIPFQSGAAATGEIHYAAELDSTTTVEDSGTVGNWSGSAWQTTQVHGYDGNSAGTWSAYYVAAFEGKLSQAKLDAILADPEAYFFSAAGPTPIQWDGPNIPDQVFTVGTPITTVDFASGFSGSQTPFSYDETPTYTIPPGLTLGPADGQLTGTPTTEQAATPYRVRGTDQDSATADSNELNITINAAALLPTLVIPVIKDANEAAQADIAGCSIRARDTTDDTFHKYEGTLTTDASGNLSVSDAALTTGRVYACEIEVPSTPSNLRGLRYVTAVDA